MTKHVASTMKGKLYKHLGHFGQQKYLRAGHNTTYLGNAAQDAYKNYGEPEDATHGKPLPSHPPANYPLTPTENNQINNIERGSGHASPSGADETKRKDI